MAGEDFGDNSGNDPVLSETIGAVRLIVLNRVKRHNALDSNTCDRLLTEISEASHDKKVRAITIAGNGVDFCAGDDIKTLNEIQPNISAEAPVDIDTGDAKYIHICEAIITSSKPVIAAVRGTVAGAGVEIACSADLRVGGPSTRFNTALLGVGHVGATAMLGRVVGSAKATSMYLLNKIIGSTEAQALGLIDVLAKRDVDVNIETLALASQLADGPTKAISLFKEMRFRIEGVDLLGELRLQDNYHRQSNKIKDSARGVEAFVNHRTPQFMGD